MSTCYKCGDQWTSENKVETPLFCPKCMKPITLKIEVCAMDKQDALRLLFAMYQNLNTLAHTPLCKSDKSTEYGSVSAEWFDNEIVKAES